MLSAITQRNRIKNRRFRYAIRDNLAESTKKIHIPLCYPKKYRYICKKN